MANENTSVRFLSIDEFKEEINVSKLEVLKNPKTGKLFMSAGGDSYRCQQDIDPNERLRVLIPEDSTIEDACLINVSEGAETQFTL